MKILVFVINLYFPRRELFFFFSMINSLYRIPPCIIFGIDDLYNCLNQTQAGQSLGLRNK